MVNSGHFRSTDLEENRLFLAEVRSQRVPRELEAQLERAGGQLHVRLDEVEADYTEEPSKSLGAAPHQHQTSANTEPPPRTYDLGTPQLDPSTNWTSLQIRLPSGQRVVRKFNQSQTGLAILDLLSEAMQVPIAEINISAGFPPRPILLADLKSKTLKDLGICDSALIVTLR